MAVSGNKMAADMGRTMVPVRDVVSRARAQVDAVNRTLQKADQNRKRQQKRSTRVEFGPPTGKNAKVYDVMPASVRKQTDKVSRVVSQAGYIADNTDSLLRKISGKRLGLPKKLKTAVKNAGF